MQYLIVFNIKNFWNLIIFTGILSKVSPTPTYRALPIMSVREGKSSKISEATIFLMISLEYIFDVNKCYFI